MTRQEHMQWCKDRALEYVKLGDGKEAMMSMISDLRKHEDTVKSVPISFAIMLTVDSDDIEAVKNFITGFN